MTITSISSEYLDLTVAAGRDVVAELTAIAEQLERVMTERVAPWYAAVSSCCTNDPIEETEYLGRVNLHEVNEVIRRIENLVRNDHETDSHRIEDPLDRLIG